MQPPLKGLVAGRLGDRPQCHGDDLSACPSLRNFCGIVCDTGLTTPYATQEPLQYKGV